MGPKSLHLSEVPFAMNATGGEIDCILSKKRSKTVTFKYMYPDL